MKPSDLPVVGDYSEVLEELGDEEPSTKRQAWAVLESIRQGKGYLDTESLQELNDLSPQLHSRILRTFDKCRATEAAYTTRSGHTSSLLINC